MDTAIMTTIVPTAGAVITGIFGMFFTANQIGRRMDDLKTDLRDLRVEFSEWRVEFHTFKDMVNSKLSAIDLEIAKLMDKRP